MTILKSMDELAKRGKINRNRAFAAWFAINFFDLEEDDALFEFPPLSMVATIKGSI